MLMYDDYVVVVWAVLVTVVLVRYVCWCVVDGGWLRCCQCDVGAVDGVCVDSRLVRLLVLMVRRQLIDDPNPTVGVGVPH